MLFRETLARSASKPRLGSKAHWRARRGSVRRPPGFSPRLDVFPLTLFTETPDSELDVIDGGFWAIPTLGLQDLRYGFRTHRKWKFKDTPVTCSDTVLVAPPRPCEIVAAFFSGKNDVPHPDAQRCLFLWARCGVKRGKRSQPMNFFAQQMPRLASLRIGKQDLNFAILSKNWGLSQKTKRPFVAIKTRTREAPAVTPLDLR